MEKCVFRKGLALAIIILFVGVSVTSSMSGNVSKMNDIKDVEARTINEAIQTNEGEPHTVSTVDWWPMFHHDLHHSGYSTSDAPDTNNVKWTYTTGNRVYSSPAVADGKVYIGAWDYNVYCLDADDGTEIWSYTTGQPMLDSSPAVADGKVYIGSVDHKVYCLDADDGTEIWSYTTGNAVCSSPAVADGKVYIGSRDKKVYCLNADTGDFIWNYTAGLAVDRSSPAVADGKIYVGSEDKHIYCLDADTGGFIWSYTTGGKVISSPAVADGKVYIGSGPWDYNVYCLDADDGTEIWSYTTGNVVCSSPAVADGKVYIGSGDAKVYCLDADDGSKIWSYTTGSGVRSSPAVADGKVYVGSYGGNVYCLDADDGTEIWTYNIGGLYSHSSPAVADGKVYIGSGDAKVYCFEDDGVSPETQRLRDALDHLKDTTTFSIKFGTKDIARVQAYVYKGLYDDINFFPQVIEDLLSAIETLEFLKDLLEMNPANLFKTLIGWAGFYTLESWSDDDKEEFGRCLKHILDDMNLDPYAPVYELEDDIKDALLNYETGPYISEHIDTISAKIDSLKNNIPDELPDDFPLDRIEEDIDRIFCAVFELPFKQPLIWFNPNGIDENDPSDDNTYSFNEVGTTYKWRSLAKRKYIEGQQHIEEGKTAGYGMIGVGGGACIVKIGVAFLTKGLSLLGQVLVGGGILTTTITAGQFSAEAVNVRWDRLLLTTGICSMAALDAEIYRIENLVNDTIDYVSKCLDDPSVFPSSCDIEIIDAQMQDIILAEDQTCGTTTGTITLKNIGTETAHGNIFVDIVQLFGYGIQSISVTGPDEIFELSPSEVKTIEFEYSAPSNVVWQCLHEYIAVIRVSLGTNLDSTQNYPGLTENLRFYVGPEEYFDYANEESSTTVISGETGGRSSWLESVPYTTKNDTNQVVFYLEFESGDFDLHIYDSEGNHVGFNYTTNETEVNIPNAWYSGPSSYPEIILINQSFGQTYMVEVMEVNVTGGVNFIVRAIEIPDRPALLSILPSTLNLIGKPGDIVNNSLLLSEIGGQKTAEDIELTITDLTDNASHVIPSSAVTFNLSATELPPLGGVDIPMDIEIPVDAVSGKYTGKINVTASNGIAAEITINVIVSHPPDTPSINGPTSGKAGTEYEYTYTATDPDGDDVYYYIDWGDETDKDWIGPYASGEEVTRSHTWFEKGTYTIRAKAIDIYGAESDWRTLTVTMPRNKAFNFNLLSWLLERFPNLFPMLQLLLQRLGPQ